MTTPNRSRLRNRVNHSRRPLGSDHINELSFNQAHHELSQAGFKVIKSTGLYVELFLNWFNRGTKVDYLQSSGNKPENIRWMNLLNRIGQFFPRYAFGMIFIASKMYHDN